MISLIVAEHFLSFQGEGSTIGTRAVFLRLAGCKLDCCFCDTEQVWKKGVECSFTELLTIFEREGYIAALNEGAHLVITGGDPLIQQKQVVEFLEYCPSMGVSTLGWFIEVETEGVIMPSSQFSAFVRIWNVSPKLSNSKMPLAARFKPDVLRWHTQACSIFKFPVASQEEYNEVADICAKCSIPLRRTYLMPISSSRQEHIAVAEKIASFAMMLGCNFSPRMQLFVWDKVTGV